MKKLSSTPKKPSIDYIIPLILIISLIVPYFIATTQYFNTASYGDDIVMVGWSQNHPNFIDMLITKMGTGFRPMTSMLLFIEYNLFGHTPFYYYMFNGFLFAGAMCFLYLLAKTLHSRIAGVTAVLFYLFLDGSFIALSKIMFITSIAEIFFITSALYYSINYFKTNSRPSLYLSIILTIFAFLTKEPSILIIPVVNLTHLYFNKQLTKPRIIVNTLPFIYLFLILFVISPDVGPSSDTNIIQRISTNLQFYLDTEATTQFKNPILLLSIIFISAYYFFTNKLRQQISITLLLFTVALLPFLITRQPVQPTYLIEANIGMTLLVGIIIAETIRKNTWILALLLVGLLLQLAVIPQQISAMQNYNSMLSSNQKTFYETIESTSLIPQNSSVFYFSNEVRQKYGNQFNSDVAQQYLCLLNQCTLRITTSYNDSTYILLPSSLDIYTFRQEYPSEQVQLIKEIKNNNDYGVILKKI